ncbi:MAG: alpha/beta hydrolase [Chloroflexi bacterium]|nr:alpha/beta hydrolase [Chloroflexota bacterium]
MPFVKVRDISIYYEIGGEGPRLLYISGTGGDLRRTPSIFDSALAEHFEILAFDQRGMGQTDKPDIPYTMADYAADTDGLMEAVGWERASVMGVSFGGMVAPELVMRYPSRVERIVLACTSSGGAGKPSYPLHELQGLSKLEHARRTMEISDMRLDAAWQAANPERLQSMLEQRMAANLIGANEPGHEIGARRQIEARRNHDVYDRLPQIKNPVFVCGGRYDGIAPIVNQKALAEQLPNARMELFEGGHGFHREDPKAYERIIAFLQGKLDG